MLYVSAWAVKPWNSPDSISGGQRRDEHGRFTGGISDPTAGEKSDPQPVIDYCLSSCPLCECCNCVEPRSIAARKQKAVLLAAVGMPI